MADDGFNGSTILFASATLGSIRGISYSSKGAKADLTATGDTEKTYASGIADKELSVDFVGGPAAIGVGSEGALSVNWFDGTFTTITTGVCIGIDQKGTMDGEITGNATFVPSK